MFLNFTLKLSPAIIIGLVAILDAAQFVVKFFADRAGFSIFGENEIDEQAKFQLYDALKLPISVKGALMPDAHSGYGLPIGGVLATENAVIPYGVGVDIGCRMSLSIFDLPASFFKGKDHQLQAILKDNTKFGMSETHKIKADHEVFYRDEFKNIPIVTLSVYQTKILRIVGQ